MTLEHQIDILQQARALLAAGHISGYRKIENSYCHIGAFCKVAFDDVHLAWPPYEYAELLKLMDATAVRLYPEAASACWSFGKPHPFPAVWVNNELGQEAILAVYDDVIGQLQQQLELNAVCEQVSAEVMAVERDLVEA